MGNNMNLLLFAFNFALLTEFCYLFVIPNGNKQAKRIEYSETQEFDLFFPQMRPEIIKKAVVELKAEEIKILDEVKKQNPATLVTISEGLGISKNQLQKLLNSLEERNLVKREGPLYQVNN